MNKPKIALVIGTRPEAIKMAPLYLKLKSNVNFQTLLITTSQHRHMLDQVLSVFKIEPDVDLNLMRADQKLPEITARIITGVQNVLSDIRPHVVLVQGDTTTCLGASLTSFYAGIPIGHVEAGLRTYRFDAPWPEEMNRRLTDPLCRWCFAPTKRAAENLEAERISKSGIFITGNTVVDALLAADEMITQNPPPIDGIPPKYIENCRIILVTGHRRESFGDPFREFCLALREIVRSHPDTIIVYPVHLNPNVQEPVYDILKEEERIFLTKPMEYLPFLSLIKKCHFIITDSGGIQEEAPSFGKPLLITRESTERPEVIEAGIGKLVGMSRDRIIEESSLLLENEEQYRRMARTVNPFGNGTASEKIVNILESSILV